MATTYDYASQTSSQRGIAMVLSLVTALVLSPLYVNRQTDSRYETRWSSGLVLPVVLAGLIVAIKSTSSSSVPKSSVCNNSVPDASWVLRIGSSSWGLAGILVLLLFVLSWQHSVQHFLWS